MRDYMHMIRERGADIRVADTLPHRLVIYDRTVSFLPVDPLRPGPAALIVREPAITANLVMLFESLWVGAQTLEEALAAASPAASELDRSVLMLMSSGCEGRGRGPTARHLRPGPTAGTWPTSSCGSARPAASRPAWRRFGAAGSDPSPASR
jgi:hypothetical protein